VVQQGWIRRRLRLVRSGVQGGCVCVCMCVCVCVCYVYTIAFLLSTLYSLLSLSSISILSVSHFSFSRLIILSPHTL
jgi:hypothetical protein